MRQLGNETRVSRLIRRYVDEFRLDMRGMRVLTEAASGPFVVTPLIAACAGAEVIAVTRDSTYGSADEVTAYTEGWANRLGVSSRISLSKAPPAEYSRWADVVTNLGFVRPLNRAFVERMKPGSVISLMFEPWEYREEDVDLRACADYGIPVLGTDEADARMRIFDYLGYIALKMMLELELEIFKSKVVLIASGPFGSATAAALRRNDIELVHIDPEVAWFPQSEEVVCALQDADAIVLSEHRKHVCLVGGNGISVESIKASGAKIIHLAGAVDDDALQSAGLEKYPTRRVGWGYMTVTTDYVGPRPVIELHAGGLKVGEALCRGMRDLGDAQAAIRYALGNSPALPMLKSPEV